MQPDRAFLLDMLEAARLAVAYVRDVSREAFLQDTQLQDSVIHRVEILGEVARRVSPRTRQSLPEIPWAGMIAMRNFLIHQYDAVDVEIVWDTVQQDLPLLIARIGPLFPQKDS